MSPTRVMHYFLLLLAGAAGCTAAPRAHRPKAGYFRYLAMEYQGSYDRPFYPVLFSTFADHPSLWSTVDFWRTVNSYNGPNAPITRADNVVLTNKEFSALARAFKAWDAALPQDSTLRDHGLKSSYGAFRVVVQDSARAPLLRTYSFAGARQLLRFLTSQVGALKTKAFRADELAHIRLSIELDSAQIR